MKYHNLFYSRKTRSLIHGYVLVNVMVRAVPVDDYQ